MFQMPARIFFSTLLYGSESRQIHCLDLQQDDGFLSHRLID